MTVPVGPKKVPVPVDFDLDDDLLPSEFSFVLGGQEWHVRHREDVPQSTIRKAFTGDIRFVDFFRHVLVPGEGDGFARMIGDVPADELAASKDDAEAQAVLAKYEPAEGLTGRKIRRAYEAVTSYVTDFPTKLAETSGPGAKPPAKKSAAGSRSKASRPAKSAG